MSRPGDVLRRRSVLAAAVLTATVVSVTIADGLTGPAVAATGDATQTGPSSERALLLAALGGVFLAILVLLAIVLTPTGDQEVTRNLRRVRPRQATEDRAAKKRKGNAAPSALGKAAMDLVQAMPKPKGYDERLQLSLERAGWPLRSGEFIVLRLLAVVLAGLVGFGLAGNPVLGGLMVGTGWLLPGAILAQRVRAREARFLGQLPDTLQLLAGSLRAGYGILQGIDTIVKETAEPTKGEFQRVLTEARLGLPLEDCLQAMAVRVGSEDFRWVTVAINIQRRVGGNLADLLETVSATLREREQVRRQISVLSAEGRLSAMILTVLPFGLAGYLAIVNPDYLGQLFDSTFGLLMVGGAVVLMLLGVVWMRNLIKIDV